MTKTEQLDKLFKKWKLEQSKEIDYNETSIKRDSFEIDGIIDESAFEKEKTKVLFISAEANIKGNSGESNYRKCYLDYHKSGYDNWGGKMRERLSGMYKYLTQQHDMELKEMANKFAVLDINKRGGGSTIKDGKHIQRYAERYKEYINEEIRIINPDVVVLVGINLCRLKIVQILGCVEEDNKNYFDINGRKIPILLSFQTANVQFQSKRFPPRPECDNTAIGILCSKLQTEMDKYNIK